MSRNGSCISIIASGLPGKVQRSRTFRRLCSHLLTSISLVKTFKRSWSRNRMNGNRGIFSNGLGQVCDRSQTTCFKVLALTSCFSQDEETPSVRKYNIKMFCFYLILHSFECSCSVKSAVVSTGKESHYNSSHTLCTTLACLSPKRHVRDDPTLFVSQHFKTHDGHQDRFWSRCRRLHPSSCQDFTGHEQAVVLRTLEQYRGACCSGEVRGRSCKLH